MSDQAVRNPEVHDDSDEYTLRTMLRQFYSRKMRSIVIVVWAQALVYMALAVLCAVGFFQAGRPREQIMYAAGFVCCVQFIALIKMFAWQTIHREGISRQIRRLEIRLSELGGRPQSRP